MTGEVVDVWSAYPVPVRVERVILARSGLAAGSSHPHRQICLAAEASASDARILLQTRGLDLASLALGRRLRVAAAAVVQVTDRVEGPLRIFARVLRDGPAASGDLVRTDPSLDVPRFSVVTLSDRGHAGLRADESGPLAARILTLALGVEPHAVLILPDDDALLRTRLASLADDDLCDLVVTTGGTGLAPRDVTPDATRAVIDREVPGIAEAIRAAGLRATPFAMLSRAVCGQRGSTLILNLSGSPNAVREQLAVVLPVLGHVMSTSSGVPQNCVEIDLARS